jgi:hypothetical protein
MNKFLEGVIAKLALRPIVTDRKILCAHDNHDRCADGERPTRFPSHNEHPDDALGVQLQNGRTILLMQARGRKKADALRNEIRKTAVLQPADVGLEGLRGCVRWEESSL